MPGPQRFQRHDVRPRRVYGYHGTSAAAAELILRDGFMASKRSYDWLGDGVYFWGAIGPTLDHCRCAVSCPRNWLVTCA